MTHKRGKRKREEYVNLRCLSAVLFLLLLTTTAEATTDDGNESPGRRPWWVSLPQRFIQRIPWFRRQRSSSNGAVPVVVDAFLSEVEATQLLERYRPLLRASLYNNEAMGGASQSRYRTSSSVRLPPLGDPLVFEIERRAASLAQFDHSQVEDFQLACYEEDQLFGLHRDDADHQTQAAHRSATVLIYLQPPEAGGATLFTRRPLEEERDLKSKQPLRAEKDALDLFRSYCEKPQRSHVVVDPVTGRAVTWRNWDTETGRMVFARDSTHGACPVLHGTKCVIQQWIALPGFEAPLRSPSVAAIFTFGADASFQERLTTPTQNGSRTQCQRDVSTQEGQLVDKICLQDVAEARFVPVEYGPLPNVSGLRVVSSGLVATLPAEFVKESGCTVSFWARAVTVETTLLSLEDYVSVSLVKEENYKQTYELRRGGEDAASSVVEFFNFESEPTDWLWFSLSIDNGKEGVIAQLSIFSQRGHLHGSASLTLRVDESCGETGAAKDKYVLLQLFMPPSASMERQAPFGVRTHQLDEDQRRTDERVAFVSSHNMDAGSVSEHLLSSSVDVSFVVIHRTPLRQEEAQALGHQASRYDVNS